MRASDTVFTGSIPAIYDGFLGPLIFADYATDLAERARALGPRRVLETAAGTGIVTRALCQALPATVAIVATDLNQSMLDYASARVAADNLSWRRADAQTLPFSDGEFDLVACQFGVMFFPDKRRAFGEARRVLRPGGRFLFNVWDRIEKNEIADLTTSALVALFPSNPPQFLARIPHGYFNAAAIEQDLQAAGFRGIETTTLAKRSRAASARAAAVGFCQGTPVRGEIEAHGKTALDHATDAATAAIVARLGSGPIDANIQALVFSAQT